MALMIPVSWGELLDKITILQIKAERIENPEKRDNVKRELEALEAVRARRWQADPVLEQLVAELRQVNEQLWDIEDEIRRCERDRCYDERFVELARSVYLTNDRRADLKYRLNQLLDSELVEEKSYQGY